MVENPHEKEISRVRVSRRSRFVETVDKFWGSRSFSRSIKQTVKMLTGWFAVQVVDTCVER